MVSKKTKRATIDEVAKLAGVSTATVSRYINKTASISSTTAAQVQKAITELNYRPKVAAQSLASKKTNTLGLIVPYISGVFFPSLLRGIEDGTQESGYDLLIYSAQGRTGEDKDETRLLGDHNTDGLIVFAHALEPSKLKFYRKIQFPLILVFETAPKGLNIPSLVIENETSAERIVSHLIETHNRRKIVFIRGPQGNEDSQLRESGYQRALQKHNIPINPNLILSGEYNSERSRSEIEALISNILEFDAVFAADDESAIGALVALRNARIKVPDQVSLVGFDDIPFANYVTPPLTTVRVPIEEMGRKAVQQLLAQINKKRTQKITRFPTELIIRQSCGCNIS
jgi:DNA-binding LacI/PurR family transcriptional regulator